MAFSGARLSVNMRGTNVVIRKLRAVTPRISEAQRIATTKVSNTMVKEAKQIIKNKAPKSKGTLRNSIRADVSKQKGGWVSKIHSPLPYAKKVESGAPAETVPLSPELRDWVERVLGKDARLSLRYKRSMTVRRGGNPMYDTRVGMQFFQKPYAKHKRAFIQEHQGLVRQALKKL